MPGIQGKSLAKVPGLERRNMGKLDGKIAVITAATSGMALETAKLFV